MLRSFILPVLQSLLALLIVAGLVRAVPILVAPPPVVGAPAHAPDETVAAVPETDRTLHHDNNADTRSPSEAINDWRPDVEQVIDQLEEILVSDIPQQQMNYTLANLNALYDTKLYLTFIDHLAALPQDMVKQALLEQQQWLLQRKELTAAAHAENAGGSLAAYNAGEAYLQATRLRLDEIERQLPEH